MINPNEPRIPITPKQRRVVLITFDDGNSESEDGVDYLSERSLSKVGNQKGADEIANKKIKGLGIDSEEFDRDEQEEEEKLLKPKSSGFSFWRWVWSRLFKAFHVVKITIKRVTHGNKVGFEIIHEARKKNIISTRLTAKVAQEDLEDLFLRLQSTTSIDREVLEKMREEVISGNEGIISLEVFESKVYEAMTLKRMNKQSATAGTVAVFQVESNHPISKSKSSHANPKEASKSSFDHLYDDDEQHEDLQEANSLLVPRSKILKYNTLSTDHF